MLLRTTNPRTGLKLVAFVLLLAAPASAEPASPFHLPDMLPAPTLAGTTATGSAVQLRLHQQLEYPLDGSPAYLSLGPSLTWDFHSPSAAAHAERQEATDQLAAIENVIMRRNDALNEHLTFLQLQHSLWTAELLGAFTDVAVALFPEWGAADTAVAAESAGEPGYRRLLQSGIERAGAELSASAQLRALMLANHDVTAPPDSTWRPVIDPLPDAPDRLEVACISGNLEFDRLMLLEAEDEAAARATSKEAELHGHLTVAASLGIGGGTDPTLAWRVALRLSPASSGAFSAEFGLSERSLSQSASFGTVRPRPVATPAQEGMWILAREDAYLQLIGLMEAWWLASEAESIQRLVAEALLAQLPVRLQQAGPNKDFLTDALDAALDLLRAAGQRDALTLELASACGLEIRYERVDYIDSALFRSRPSGQW